MTTQAGGNDTKQKAVPAFTDRGWKFLSTFDQNPTQTQILTLKIIPNLIQTQILVLTFKKLMKNVRI